MEFSKRWWDLRGDQGFLAEALARESDLRGRIRRVDPKLSLVLGPRSTAVKSFLAKRRDGSSFCLGGGLTLRWRVSSVSGLPVARLICLYVCFEDGRLSFETVGRGGGGGEWVAGPDLDLPKRLLRTGEANRFLVISSSPLRFSPFFSGFISSTGLLCCVWWLSSPCFSSFLSVGSCSIFRFVQLRCSGSGDKSQSTWCLF